MSAREPSAARSHGSPHSDSIRWASRSSALLRLLTHDEANGEWACCCWSHRQDTCDAMPCFRLATPHGHQDYCRDHIDPAIASLPLEWLDQWAYREPVAVGEESDDIPF